MSKGLIIPNNVITFNDGQIDEYFEQSEHITTSNRSPGLNVRGDTADLKRMDYAIQSATGPSDDCGCGGKEPLSFEYKAMAVLIGVVIIWTFVTWGHHHMTSH